MALETIWPQDTLTELIWDINRDINNGELTEIIEVTYSYLDFWEHHWNTTLFTEFAGCEKSSDFSHIWNTVWEKLQQKISKIDQYLEKLKKYEETECDYDATESSNNANHIRHWILFNSLIATQNTLNMALIWLPFELEKAGMVLNMPEEELKDRVKGLEDLESKNFWGNVRDNQVEITACYENLLWFYTDKKDLLSIDEQTRYEKYLQKIIDILPHGYLPWVKKIQSENNFSSKLKWILDAQISRELYSQDFLTILNDFLNLDFDVKIEKWRGSIYDWPWYLAIPAGDNYKNKSVRALLKLIVHELESHSTNLRTTEDTLWQFRWAGSVTKEEALAMMSEQLLMGENIENIWITKQFPKILMWELLWNSEELEDFLFLNNKIDPDTASPRKRMLRIKRNYPLWYKWGQHKDTAYSRWILEIKDFLLSGWDIRDYFVWKVSWKDLPKMKRIIELEWKSESIRYPFMLAELFLYHLFPISERPEKDFLTYLKNKYPFINFENEEVRIMALSQKRKVIDILWHLRHKFPDRKINTLERLDTNEERLSFPEN